jgi:hypothetical protein
MEGNEMNKLVAIILVGAATAGCHDSNSPNTHFPVFDGTTGSTWEMMASSPLTIVGMQSYVPDTSSSIVNVSDQTDVNIYDIAADSWTAAASPAPASDYWMQAAPVGDNLWLMKNNEIYEYDVATDTWTDVTSWTGSDDESMTESDENGVIYSHSSDGNFVVYDTTQPPGANNPSYVSDTSGGNTSETRMGYDPKTRSIFFGGYGYPELFKWEIDTGNITQVTSIPENQLNDIFCSDRSGHIYAAGDSSGTTMFQYDIATDTWSPIPDLPVDHGNNYTCTVDSGNGYLYTSSDTELYRLKLN